MRWDLDGGGTIDMDELEQALKSLRTAFIKKHGEHTWSPPGPHLVPPWSPPGPHLVPAWSPPGPRLVPTWSPPGPRLSQELYRSS